MRNFERFAVLGFMAAVLYFAQGQIIQKIFVSAPLAGAGTSSNPLTCSTCSFSGSAAGGDLSGTYPNPTVAKINGATLGTTTATSGRLLLADGSQWASQAMSGACTITSAGVTSCSAGATNALQTNAGSGAFGSVTAPTSAYPKTLIQRTGQAPSFSQCSIAGVPLENCAFVKVVGSNLATGDTDLFTCPSGKRCLIGALQAYNPSAGTVSWFVQVRFLGAGSYFRLSVTTNTTSGTGAVAPNGGQIILEATDILSVNAATTAGLNVIFTVLQFDNSAALKTVKLTGPSSGNNTLYTAPNGGSAAVLNYIYTLGGIGNNQQPGHLHFVADAGGARNVYYNVFANGGSPGTTNQYVAATSSACASCRVDVAADVTLGSQDVLSVNVDTGAAAQIFWVNIVEFTQ